MQQKIFTVLFCVLAAFVNPLTIRGNVRVPSGITSVPDGTWLIVKLRDVTNADSQSHLMGKYEKEIKSSSNLTEQLTYVITKDMGQDSDAFLTVSSLFISFVILRIDSDCNFYINGHT